MTDVFAIQDEISRAIVNSLRLKLGGGPERIRRQHDSGKLTAREHAARLLDRDPFQEAGLFARHNGRFFGMGDKDLPADGVVTGRGRICGATVGIVANQPNVLASALEIDGPDFIEDS